MSNFCRHSERSEESWKNLATKIDSSGVALRMTMNVLEKDTSAKASV